jgi:hypothetical protein
MRRFRLLAAVCGVLALIVPAPVTAVAPPYLDGEIFLRSWGGAPYVASVTTCNPSGNSTISYTLSTAAPDPYAYQAIAGPYAGSWTETATFVIGPQTHPATGFISQPAPVYSIQGSRGYPTGQVLSATIEFEINGPDGVVTGTKSYAGASDAFGFCVTPNGDPPTSEIGGAGPLYGFWWGVRGTLAYDAQITNSAGSFTDDGTALVAFEECKIVRGDPGGGQGSIGCGNFAEIFASDNAPQGAASVTVTPESATNPVGTAHSVLATATTAANQPASGTTLLLSVSGSTTNSQTCVADINGQCSFTYTGPAFAGADLILVCADNDGNGSAGAGEPCAEATKAWLLPTSTPGQVTGGGQVLTPQDNEKVAFGFTAKSTPNGLIGNCSVVDIAPTRNVKIKCTSVTSLVVSGNHAAIYGEATINGAATTYRIEVTDSGEPGTGADTFTILTGSGYSAGGYLDSGNVQVHS